MYKISSIPNDLIDVFATIPSVLQLLGWFCLVPATPIFSLAAALAYLKAAVKAGQLYAFRCE